MTANQLNTIHANQVEFVRMPFGGLFSRREITIYSAHSRHLYTAILYYDGFKNKNISRSFSLFLFPMSILQHIVVHESYLLFLNNIILKSFARRCVSGLNILFVSEQTHNCSNRSAFYFVFNEYYMSWFFALLYSIYIIIHLLAEHIIT